MQTRILCALVALAVAGTAVAQAVQPPPPAGTGTPPTPLAGSLPPLPRGCAGRDIMPPPRPPVATSGDGLASELGISSAQASRVQQVFERQSTQAQRLDRQRREMDAETCRNLRSIVGDQGMARWSAAAPPPPPPGGPGRRGPARGPGIPTPPPPPQGN